MNKNSKIHKQNPSIPTSEKPAGSRRFAFKAILHITELALVITAASLFTRWSIYKEHPEIAPVKDEHTVVALAHNDSSLDGKKVVSAAESYGPDFPRIKDTDVPVIFPDDKLMQKKLVDFVKARPDALEIVTNPEDYPEGLISLMLNEPDSYDFVKGYVNAEPKVYGGITDEEMEEEFPLFVQWDPRWGYSPYGNGNMARCGCAPTAISMVAVALTRDSSFTPDVVADYCMEKGLYVNNSGTDWTFFTKHTRPFGITGKVLLTSEQNMIRALNAGHLIVMSLGPGEFTDSGHIAVIVGYEDGKFIIRDPGSRVRSEQLWSFSRLAPQLKGLWEFSLSR